MLHGSREMMTSAISNATVQPWMENVPYDLSIAQSRRSPATNTGDVSPGGVSPGSVSAASRWLQTFA
jgi:hypothetical protein